MIQLWQTGKFKGASLTMFGLVIDLGKVYLRYKRKTGQPRYITKSDIYVFFHNFLNLNLILAPTPILFDLAVSEDHSKPVVFHFLPSVNN